MLKTRKILLPLIAIAALALPAPAMAQRASLEGYEDDSSIILNDIERPGEPPATDRVPDAATPAPTASETGGELPFTGLDLALLGVAGAGLLGLGLGIRRLARPADPV